MHIMWWGSILQSLSTELFLALRRSTGHHSAKFYKRLDASESSTGESAAYADNWVRADYSDFAALAKWCEKTTHDSIVIFDLWGFIVSGRDISLVEHQLQVVIENASGVIFLLPKMHVAEWYDKLEEDYSGSRYWYSEILKNINSVKRTYEYLLNSSSRFGIIESSIHFRDFCNCAELDFSKARKFAGLFYLVPGELARGPLAFTAAEDFCSGILRMLDKLHDEADSHLVLNLRNNRLESFISGRNLNLPSVTRNSQRSRVLIARRKDGQLAICSNWSMYLSTIQKGRSKMHGTLSQLSTLERKFLIFLLQFESSLPTMGTAIEEPLPSDVISRPRLQVS